MLNLDFVAHKCEEYLNQGFVLGRTKFKAFRGSVFFLSCFRGSEVMYFYLLLIVLALIAYSARYWLKRSLKNLKEEKKSSKSKKEI